MHFYNLKTINNSITTMAIMRIRMIKMIRYDNFNQNDNYIYNDNLSKVHNSNK